MKVLLCHNFYQRRGGEDQVFEDESWLLRSRGHEVIEYTRHNDDVDGMNHLAVAGQTLWSRRTYRELRAVLRARRPEVMHCTNTFPLISPAAYYAAQAEGVAVVQSLHNYRLFCSNGFFYRNGGVCELCLHKRVSWPSVLHRCYRGSLPGSAVVTALQTGHRLVRTWDNLVDVYVALSEFSRDKFIEGGMPAEKMFVKPNLVHPDPGPGPGDGGYAVFVGRLAPEKGVDVMLDAWDRLPEKLPLKIVGDGPLAEQAKEAAARSPHVQWLGFRPLAEVLDVIGRARLLVMPSMAYETFGRTVIEAFARGTPVVASNRGPLKDLVDHGRTGLLFEATDADDFAAQVRRLPNDPAEMAAMRRAARAEYESKYTADANYPLLLDVYRRAVERRAAADRTNAKLGLIS